MSFALKAAAVSGDVVEVIGIRASLENSIEQKKESVGILDAISAEDIGDFPDLNISESLQRIPGVTINRVLGEGQQVSVRGLAPEFTRVTINGKTVTSGNSGREVDFDVFASELFYNVSIKKSQDASTTEGGLAAAIDMRTARPFDLKKQGTQYAFSSQGVMNDLREKATPRISGLISNNQLFGGKLGVLGSVSYSQSDLRQDNVEGLRYLLFHDYDIGGDGTIDHNDVEIPFIPRYVLEMKDRKRLGLTGALQYRPNDRLDFNFDIAYAKFDEERTRYSIDGLLNGDRSTPVSATVDNTGYARKAAYGNVSSRSENIFTPSEEDLLLLNFETGYKLTDSWKSSIKLGHSKSTKESREFRAVYNAVDRFTYDFSDDIFVGLSPENTDFTNPDDFRHNQSRFINDDITDTESSGQLDLSKSFNINLLRKISFGGRISSREKGNVRYDGRFTAKDAAGNPLPVSDAIAASFPVDDFFGQYDNSSIVRDWFVTDFDAVFADPEICGANFEIPQRYISTFTIDEQTTAGYIRADAGNEWFQANLGVRLVSTNQTSDGFLGDGMPVSQTNSYTEVLPSLNSVFNLSHDLLFRTTVSKSMTRPTLSSLTPGGTVAPGAAVPVIGGGTAKLGNPNLKPFMATQFDFSLESYFADGALLSFTYFRKDVDNFIVSVTEEKTIDVGSLLNDNGEEVGNAPFTVTQPVNGESSFFQGFEISLQTPFTLFSDGLDGFGTLINYTYSDGESQIPFNGKVVKTLFPGQSQHSFNIIGYYEKGKFSGRLAYSWRDEYLYEVRASDTQRSNFIDAYGQLDANLQYEIFDNILLVANGLNLLDNESYRYAETKDRNIAFSKTGRFITLGVRVKY